MLKDRSAQVMRYLLLLAPVLVWAGPARYARLGDFTGTVEVQVRAAEPWTAAERNLPLPESAWVRTGEGSRVEIELDEGSMVRLGPNTQAGLADYSRLSTGQRVTLLLLDRGLAYVTGQPEGRDALAVAVPGAQVTFTRGGRVRLEVEEQWSQIALLRGARAVLIACGGSGVAGRADHSRRAGQCRAIFLLQGSAAARDR